MVNFIKQGDIFNLNGVRSYAHGCKLRRSDGKRHSVAISGALPQNVCRVILLILSGNKKGFI